MSYPFIPKPKGLYCLEDKLLVSSAFNLRGSDIISIVTFFLLVWPEPLPPLADSQLFIMPLSLKRPYLLAFFLKCSS